MGCGGSKGTQVVESSQIKQQTEDKIRKDNSDETVPEEDKPSPPPPYTQIEEDEDEDNPQDSIENTYVHPSDDITNDEAGRGSVHLKDDAVEQVGGITSSPHNSVDNGGSFPSSATPRTSESVLDIPDVSENDFHPFPEFPTPHLLREANKQYTELKKSIPLDENKVILPYPTPSTKREKFLLDDFRSIDDHAIKCPGSLTTKSLKDLVRHLCSAAQDDTAKVRVIFRWLTAQDISAIDIDKHQNADTDTVMYYLVKLKQDKWDYSRLFIDLCEAADLQSKRITGLVKGSDYSPGEEVPDTSFGSWAAVVIDNQWRLFDPHWSARHETGGGFGEWELIDDNGQGAKQLETTDAHMKYQHNESYFLTDPEEMVYSHLPRDGEEWQMLARPVTKREFNEMVFLKPPFFDLDLEIISHKQCLIEAQDGEVEVELGLPMKRRRFMYRLWISAKGDDQSGSVGDFKLDRFVFMQQLGQKLIVKVSFPQAGKYKFELFCRDAEEETNGPATYSNVCTYIVLSDKAKEDIQPWPENVRKEWGPGLDMHLTGLHPESHKDAVIEAENGMVQIRLKADKHMEMLHELHSNNKTKEELKEYVLHEVNGEDIIIYAKVPERGEYAMNLYAKENGKEGAFPNVCSYLVTSDQGAFDGDPYPDVTNGRLGATDAGTQYGIRCISHQSAFIEAPESGELEIDLSLPGPFQMNSHLYHRNGKEHLDMDKYRFMSQDKNKANIKLQLPEAGYYSLKVFGKPDDIEGESLPSIYNFVIHVPTPKENCLPFPKAFTVFSTNKCLLEDPGAGELPSNQKVPVSLVVPNASRVATISSDGWTQLEKDAEGKWTGMADSGDAGTQMKVTAEFKEGSNSFETLLLYDVKEVDDIDAALKKQLEAKDKAERQQEEERERQRLRQVDIEKSRKELQEAIDKRDMKAIKKLLNYIEKKRYVTHLKDEVEEAKQLLKSLERIEQLKKAVLNMDSATMAEIRRYASPPQIVHEVMIAALLLMGDHEGKTRDWKQCQKLCVGIGEYGLVRRVKDFKIQNLHPEIAARGRFLLSRFRLDHVSEKSAGAGTFYAWTLGMCEEVRLLNKAATKANPASLKRQKEIFERHKSRNKRK